MHDTAYEIAKIFFKSFLTGSARILEVGSLDINGSLRDLASNDTRYVGVDIVAGKSVDLVLEDPHKLPFPADSFDAVVSSSCFEHDNFFWISFLEMCRVTKEGGFIYINSPSNGAYHAHPFDFWRFYPDSAKALLNWALHNEIVISLIESFIANRKRDHWNDCVMIFKKGPVNEFTGPFISDFFHDTYNLTRFPHQTTQKVRALTEDMLIIESKTNELSNANKNINRLILAHAEERKQFEPIKARLENLKRFCDAHMQPFFLGEWLLGLTPNSFHRRWKKAIFLRDIGILKRSQDFDPTWYMAKYPDVAAAGVDPATHYIVHGEKEGRQPGVEYNHLLDDVLRYRSWASTGSYHVRFLRALTVKNKKLPKPRRTTESYSHVTSAAALDVRTFFRGKMSPGGQKESNINILFIGHEATLTGAPIGFLDLIRELTRKHPINPLLVLQSGGPLLEKFKEVVPVLLIPELTTQTGSFENSARLICRYFSGIPGAKAVFANTAATSTIFCELLKDSGIPYYLWIQEMAEAIDQHFGGAETMSYLSTYCESIFFLSQLCFESNTNRFGLNPLKLKIVEPSVRLIADKLPQREVRNQIRRELGLPENALLALGCGTIEYRKGIDLFVQTAIQYYSDPCPRLGALYFIWVGKTVSPENTGNIISDLKKAGLEKKVLLLGEQSDPDSYFKASDVFLFTSRSETLGLVAIEAIGYRLPIVGFKNCTGAEVYIAQGFGVLVPYLDTAAMVKEVKKYLLHQATIRGDGDNFVRDHFSPERPANLFLNEIERKLAPQRVKREKTVLVASTGCPPLCRNRADGGGLRAWGLAKYLKALLTDIKVIMCYSVELEETIEDGCYDGVFVTRWKPETLRELISQSSTIIVTYCSGDFSRDVIALLEPWQQLILDCNVPIYVELCARRSENIQDEFDSIQREITVFNENLRRGDYFLCANPAQVTYYQGILSALGRVNPKTFADIGLRIVPYGIDSTEPMVKTQPIKMLLGQNYKTSRKILWFGALYPWFNIIDLLESIRILNSTHPTCLIVVGALNPFNHHPDFVAAAAKAEALFSSSKYRSFVYTHDWVAYEDRADWYLDCDVIITLNEPGVENGLSWRTRVVDYVWSGIPLATNGGDPLGEDLISYGAACRLDISSAENLAETISSLWNNSGTLHSMKEKMRLYRPKLYWSEIVKPLAEVVQSQKLARDRNQAIL